MLYTRAETMHYVNTGKWIILIISLILLIINLIKYNSKKYDLFCHYWKDEDKNIYFKKGFLVLL